MVLQNTLYRAALYADTQNWGRTVAEKASVLEQALAAWPADLPKVTLVSLYVDADQEHYWQTVVENLFRYQAGGAFQIVPPEVEIYPVQRYSGLAKENSADIALVLDALDALLTGLADFVAVVSNDSDFVALYYKLQEIQERDPERFAGNPRGDAPFLLITHGNSGRSDQIDNLPGANRYHIPFAGAAPPPPPAPAPAARIPAFPPPAGPAREHHRDPAPAPAPAPFAGAPRRPAPPTTLPNARPSITDEIAVEQVAGGIASGIGRNHWDDYDGVYVFSYTDAYNVVRGRWQHSREFSYDRAHFSRWFHEEIWPVMERLGATVSNSYTKFPQQYRYRMTPDVHLQLRDMDPEKRPPSFYQY